MAKKNKTKFRVKRLKDYIKWNDKEYDRLLKMKEDITLQMKELLDDHAEALAEINELENN